MGTIIILNEQFKEKGNLNNNFWKWFGGSKIKENGKPLICYHGTSEKNLKYFDIEKIGRGTGNYGHYGYGFYLSVDIRESKIYGNNIYSCYVKMKNPFTGTDKQILQLKNNGTEGIEDLVPISIDFKSFKNSFKNQPIVFKFIEDIEKIGVEKAWNNIWNSDIEVDEDFLTNIYDFLEYTTLNKEVDGVPDEILNDLKELGISPKINKGFPYQQSLHWITDLGNRSKEITDIIKKLGYDGVWYGSEIVAFYPNQIKSVDNDGTWDGDDDNIFS